MTIVYVDRQKDICYIQTLKNDDDDCFYYFKK